MSQKILQHLRLVLIAIVLMALPVSAHTLHIPSASVGQQAVLTDSSAVSEGIPVSFKSGKYTLQGKLIAPKNKSTKVPAIVFCVGSGEESSYTSSYAAMLDTLLEQNLPLDSVALLYFDKRGVGASEGKWYNTTFEERAADAKAAADYLKTLPFIDGNRIAVMGHSQGGWITQICLSKYPETFAGGISMAGPTFDVREQLVNDYTSALICREHLTAEEARLKATKKANLAFAAVSVLPRKGQWKQLKVIKKFEPDQYLSNIQKPLLLMFGENDGLVSPVRCMAELNRLYPQGLPANIQAVTIQGVNHGFKLADFCYQGSWDALSYSAECKKQIRLWTSAFIKQQL